MTFDQLMYRAVFGYDVSAADAAFEWKEIGMTKGDVARTITYVLYGYDVLPITAVKDLRDKLKYTTNVCYRSVWMDLDELMFHVPEKGSHRDVRMMARVGPWGKTHYYEVSLDEMIYDRCMRLLELGDVNGDLHNFLASACTTLYENATGNIEPEDDRYVLSNR